MDQNHQVLVHEIDGGGGEVGIDQNCPAEPGEEPNISQPRH